MTFEKWDPEIVKEEEGADGDNHDQTSLAAQELSKLLIRFGVSNCPFILNNP